MRKLFVTCAVILLAAFASSQAQVIGDAGYMGTEGGMLYGGVGYARINDQNFMSISARPEVAFGKIGIGLNINLLFNAETGEIRKEDWDSGYDYFRLLRYIRYGHKWDPVYARVGTLDAARLGHGFILNYYTNEASYDMRKIGLAFDLDMGRFGFETVTSNLGRAEIIGGRLYYRPLRDYVKIPIVENIALGGTFVRDFDPDVWKNSNDGVSEYGVDVELPIIKTTIFNTMVYYDWAQLYGYETSKGESRTFGNGSAFGLTVNFTNLGGLLDLSAKVERRLMGKEFMASFFDPFYELARYQVENGQGVRKSDLLPLITEKTKGIFGELYGSMMGNKVRLLGMFTRLDDHPKSGVLHIGADAPDAIPTVAAHAIYDKIGIETLGDVFSLDNRSIMRVGLGYKIKPYLIMYVDYIWTFAEKTPGSKEYETQKRIEPKLVFSYQF
jgi:hypothetical protein